MNDCDQWSAIANQWITLYAQSQNPIISKMCQTKQESFNEYESNQASHNFPRLSSRHHQPCRLPHGSTDGGRVIATQEQDCR